MQKPDAIAVCNFIEKHYDHVGQEEWFDFCDLILNIVITDANKGGYSEQLASEFPFFFEPEGASDGNC